MARTKQTKRRQLFPSPRSCEAPTRYPRARYGIGSKKPLPKPKIELTSWGVPVLSLARKHSRAYRYLNGNLFVADSIRKLKLARKPTEVSLIPFNSSFQSPRARDVDSQCGKLPLPCAGDWIYLKDPDNEYQLCRVLFVGRTLMADDLFWVHYPVSLDPCLLECDFFFRTDLGLRSTFLKGSWRTGSSIGWLMVRRLRKKLRMLLPMLRLSSKLSGRSPLLRVSLLMML